MHNKNSGFINDRILATHQAMLKIEKDWLKSINAPVKRLPKHVAEAVAIRMLFSSLPLDATKKLTEDIAANQVIKQALDSD